MSQNSHFSDQELDTLFKEAADQVTAPAFNDAYWAEVESMLPVKKRKGVVFWFTVGGIPIVLGIIGLSLFGWTRNEQSLAQKPITHQTPQNASSVPDKISESSAPVSDLSETNMPVKKQPQFSNHEANKNIRNTEYTALNPNGVLNQNTAASAPEMKSIPDSEGTQPFAAVKENDRSLGQKAMIFTTPVTLNDVGMNSKTNRSLPIYIDFALGYGQSYRQIAFENNWMSQFRVGAGIYTGIGNMSLTAGIDLRAEVPGNLSRVTSDASVSNVTNMRGIYSVEFPLYAGGSWGRSSLGALMIPGIQLGYSGTNARYENTTLVSRNQVVGTIPDSKSLTMEFGARYGYALTERVQFAASMNVDVLRPFQSDTYSGEIKKLPVSFFLGLRRTF
jgi:hypothetical protein